MTEKFVTLPREVLEQALDAFENAGLWKQQQTMQALSDALEQPQAEQEPVAWMHQCNKRPDLFELSFSKREPMLAAKGYKARPLVFGDIAYSQSKRKPLTDAQITEATGSYPGTSIWLVAVAFTRAVESAHNIK